MILRLSKSRYADVLTDLGLQPIPGMGSFGILRGGKPFSYLRITPETPFLNC
jgi:hypothetical protein